MLHDISTGDLIILSEGEYEVIGVSKIYNIYVNCKATIILNNIDIDLVEKSKAAIYVDRLGDVEIVYKGNNSLKSGDNYAGIQMSGKCKVLISGEEDISTINIESGASAAGIGGGYGYNLDGKLTIKSGTFNIVSRREGAGIGGGNGTNGEGDLSGSVIIEGGTLNITSGDYGGAGIGGGCSGSLSGDVTINGGIINSKEGEFGIGAGIGGGYDGNLSGSLTINSGKVLAIGGEGAAGIGGAISISKGGNLSGEVVINGGNTIAIGGIYLENYGGAGIGGGFSGNLSGKIAMNGGKITADRGGDGDDIGSGSKGEVTGEVTVNIKNIEVSPKSLDFNIGEFRKITPIITLTAKINADIAKYDMVEYLSEDINIVTVNEVGLVEAIGKGKSKIMVTSTLDKSKSGICEVNVGNKIIYVGEIDLLIKVKKNNIDYDELESVVCYGNNPIIKEEYRDENIAKINTLIDIPTCYKKVNVSAEYKNVSAYLSIDYSIALFTSEDCMSNLKIYALQESNIFSRVDLCIGMDEEFDISKFEIVLTPIYEIDKNYSEKYYLFKIAGSIGLVRAT